MKFRKVAKLEADRWVAVPFEELKKGDVFCYYEKEVPEKVNVSQKYVAVSDAYPTEPEGNWAIDI